MSSIVCPTILARSESEYAEQIKRITPFAHRIQIDLMDGIFAGPKSVPLSKVWWPAALTADLHLMYRNPMEHLRQLLHLKPHMVIIHAEADVHHMHFAAELHKEGVEAGLAVLPRTSVSSIEPIINSFDHLLIFSGRLGHFGGQADLSLLQKVRQAKAHHPDLEIGWDGGVGDSNAAQLLSGGVNVLNAGGYIQKAGQPEEAYKKLSELL